MGMTPNTISILNAGTKNIRVGFSEPSIAYTPEPSHLHQSSEKKEYSVGEHGTMNLFIWDEDGTSKLWSGIIPTKVKADIRIFPNDQQVVMYNQMPLPEGFIPVTDPSSQGFTKVEDDYNYTLILSIIIIVLLISYYVWSKR